MSALDDLIARDAGLPAANGSALDALIARDGGAAEQPAARIKLEGMASNAKEPTLYDSIGRQVGLTARAGINALTGLPTMLGDAANSAINLGSMGINKLTGSNIGQLELPSAIVQNTMNAAGMPQPQGAQENIVQGIASGMGSAGPGVALGKAMAKYSASVIKEIGEGLASLPGMQVFGGAGAGAGGSVAKEAELGPAGQIGSALAGGVLGAVAPSAGIAAVRGVGNIANNAVGVAQPIINPQKFVGKQLAEALGKDGPTVAENIRNASIYVPDSLPTTAQAGGTAKLVATEKSAANSNPDLKTALAAREAENNAARWRALDSVGRTPQELEAAIADRRAVTQPLYEAAHNQVAPINKVLLTLAQRPAMKQAMQSADQLAKNEGVQVKWPTPDDPHISGKALDYTNRALGDLISSAKSANRGEEAVALTGAQKQLQAWTEKNIPGIKEAASDYRTFSSPVNTMEAGQHIAGNLGTRALDVNGLPKLELSSYRSALAKALRQQEFGIDEGAHKTLQGIGQDLQRGTISNSLRSPGSDTAYNIAADGWLAKQIYGKEFDGATALGRGAGALGAALTGHPFVGMGILGGGKKLGETVGNNLNKQLAELLLNPEALLPYLDAAAKKTPQALPPALGRNVSRGAIGASVGARANP